MPKTFCKKQKTQNDFRQICFKLWMYSKFFCEFSAFDTLRGCLSALASHEIKRKAQKNRAPKGALFFAKDRANGA